MNHRHLEIDTFDDPPAPRGVAFRSPRTWNRIMKPMLLVAAFAPSLLSCKSERTTDLSLQERVHSYCHDLAFHLQQGAEKYADLAAHLDSGQMSPEQIARADQTLTVDAVGVSDSAHFAKLIDLQNQMHFCIWARTIDDQRADEITIRYQHVSEGVLREASHVDKAKTLGEMAAIAREVDALPLRQ